MTSTLMLRGQEFELDTLAVDVAINSAFFSLTVTAVTKDASGVDTTRMFSHTHLEDVDEEGIPDNFGDVVTEAVAAFKAALNSQGGFILEAGEDT